MVLVGNSIVPKDKKCGIIFLIKAEKNLKWIYEYPENQGLVASLF